MSKPTPEKNKEVFNPNCAVCGLTGPDSRTLVLKYFYELTEISDKLTLNENGLYQITTRKDCRATFLGLLRRWIRGDFIPVANTNPNYNIPVRVDGSTVMMDKEGYEAWREKNNLSPKKPTSLTQED